MLELAVQLSVECLVVGKKTMSHSEQTTLHWDSQNLITLAFSYLKLIFNPECSYHQRCRDRTTNTGTYVLVSYLIDALLIKIHLFSLNFFLIFV